MSIKHQVTISLSVVLLLHLFTAVMGHIGLERAQRDMKAAEAANVDAIVMLEVDRTIVELQRSVASFILSGHQSIADRVSELVERADLELDEALLSSPNDLTKGNLEEMQHVVSSYAHNFSKVEIDREARRRLVREVMFPARDAAVDSIRSFRSTDPASREIFGGISEHLLIGETAALRYLDTPGRDHIEAAYAELNLALDKVNEIPSHLDTNELRESITMYRDAFLEMVAATRGYLHLVNVVLAGEAEALLYHSSFIRNQSLRSREEILAKTQSDAFRFQFISDTIAVITLIAGAITAMLLTRLVFKPILRLTKTLHQLANGENHDEIIGVRRNDEVGAMAKAAEVFRVNNIEAEKLLDESQRMSASLEQRNNEMTQFVYTVSHDLKSPIVTIRGFAQLLPEIVASGDLDDLTKTLSRITGASDRMAQTIEDLLELSRIGVVIRESKRVNIRELVESVLADLQSDILTADAKLEMETPLGVVTADYTRMRQVIQNLIQNAVKYGRPDSGTHRVIIRSERIGEEAVISVTDHGNGIDNSFHEKIFGIFQRLDVSVPGTGVGLAIVKKIAEAHGGRAWLESEPGRGSTFYVSFPRSDIARDEGCIVVQNESETMRSR